MAVPWIPREEKFFDMLDQIGEILVRAARVFAELVEHFDQLEHRARDLKDLEHECDLAVESVFKALGRTFLTPIDREDIHKLATSLDDVMDFMEETAFRLVSFGIERPTPEATKLALIVEKSCEHVHRAVKLCRRQIGTDEMTRVLREISRLENEADEIFRTTEARLFVSPPEIMQFIRWKELYESFESTVDACRDVAHVINEIVVKGS